MPEKFRHQVSQLRRAGEAPPAGPRRPAGAPANRDFRGEAGDAGIQPPSRRPAPAGLLRAVHSRGGPGGARNASRGRRAPAGLGAPRRAPALFRDPDESSLRLLITGPADTTPATAYAGSGPGEQRLVAWLLSDTLKQTQLMTWTGIVTAAISTSGPPPAWRPARSGGARGSSGSYSSRSSTGRETSATTCIMHFGTGSSRWPATGIAPWSPTITTRATASWSHGSRRACGQGTSG